MTVPRTAARKDARTAVRREAMPGSGTMRRDMIGPRTGGRSPTQARRDVPAANQTIRRAVLAANRITPLGAPDEAMAPRVIVHGALPHRSAAISHDRFRRDRGDRSGRGRLAPTCLPR